MKAIRLAQTDLAKLDFEPLACFSKYRRFPGFAVSETAAIARAETLAAAADAGSVCASAPENNAAAIACLYPLTWDTGHFGMPMYRLDVLSSADAGIDDCSETIACAIRDAALATGSHISAEVDIDDYSSLNGLLRNGFEILDLKRTYCTNRMRNDIDFVRMRSRVRHYHPDDFDAVMDLVRATRFPSRFSRDQYISPEQASLMYQKWFAALLSEFGKTSNAVVYERHGEVVGCGALGEKDFAYAGLERKFRTGSLYAGRPDAVGAYTPVLYQLIIEALESHGLVDTTVSLNNVTVCRVLEGFRSYKSAAASYSLRKMIAQ